MRPAPALIAGALLLAAIGLAVAFAVVPSSALLFASVLLVALATLDALAVLRLRTPLASRESPQILPLGVRREIGLRLHPADARTLRVDVHDGHPPTFSVGGLPRRVDLRAHASTRFDYAVTAHERGSYPFAPIQLRLHSPLRLWTHKRLVDAPAVVKVYPDFAPLRRLALVGADQASRVLGAHLRRRRGDGTEFHQLREYREGDSLRQIDWKASQRARKLISRDYREERNQQVMLLLDTGRRMLARDGAHSHFDHVLNASLLLAWIALRQGDAVGLFAHGGASRFIKPQRGLGALDPMLGAIYDLQPQPVATDYLAAATELGLRQPRRSLVVMITNVRDEDVEDLLGAVRQLRRRHVVIVASLREKALDQAREQEPKHFDDALLVGATALYLEDRRRAHDALRAHGASVLDVDSDALPAALVERYLAIKREGVL
ncbi:MAG: DUF58 domain-containing protein [Rhodanobacteraceae bacterium]|jgi:uncharacterized protein (DUF58 family)|nr:DUF58 domain-containing protein [Rhodanobacteraceae bacterium]MBP6078109.1 DUF58 domain-containing protein [Xanthomonadales bacterium]MBP7624185.1 DUF58 domain-containing protein [Xanthomonadales bacterium]